MLLIQIRQAYTAIGSGGQRTQPDLFPHATLAGLTSSA